MATVTGALQTMGRGLRLPFGVRVDGEEIDRLDVLCFGKQSLMEVIEGVLEAGFGDGDERETYIDVKKLSEASKEPPETKRYLMKPKKKVKIVLPNIELEYPIPDLSALRVKQRAAKNVAAVRIEDPETIRMLAGSVGFERDYFIEVVTNLALKRKRLLSVVTDYRGIKQAVIHLLKDAGVKADDLVEIEPELAAIQITDAIDALLTRSEPKYFQKKGKNIIACGEFEIGTPNHFEKPYSSRGISASVWKDERLKRIPIAGWKRCIYEAVPFDTFTEFHIAQVLDRSDEIDWWARNLRQILKISTPIGTYAPDYLFLLKTDNANVLLEIKGEFLAAGETSEAEVKANAAEEWCHAVSQVTKLDWMHWMVLDRDARRIQSLAEIRELAEEMQAFKNL